MTERPILQILKKCQHLSFDVMKQHVAVVADVLNIKRLRTIASVMKIDAWLPTKCTWVSLDFTAFEKGVYVMPRGLF